LRTPTAHSRPRSSRPRRTAAPAEGGAGAVAGVGQHGPEPGAGGDDPVDLRERDVGLRQGAAVLPRHAGPGAAVRVGHPFLRQEQPEPDRRRDLASGQGEGDEDLAVGPFAEAAAVLPGHADRVPALLRQGGVVDDQHRVRPADERVRLPGQDPPQRGVIPGRAGDEVLELVVAAEPEPRRHWLEALAAVRAEQAVQVEGRPPAPGLAAQHREERRQPRVQRRLDGRCLEFSHATSPRPS
jgi:hypothetical protein